MRALPLKVILVKYIITIILRQFYINFLSIVITLSNLKNVQILEKLI